VNRGGRCLIPVFALGRAQELLLILGECAVPLQELSQLSWSVTHITHIPLCLSCVHVTCPKLFLFFFTFSMFLCCMQVKLIV
jgi:predicted metal-dependent RNase